MYDPGLTDENKEFFAMLNERNFTVELFLNGKTVSRKVYVMGTLKEEMHGPLGEEFERETPLGKIRVSFPT